MIVARREVSTPVVLLVYRRPEQTRAVLGAIAGVAPRKLYVFGDGARDANERPNVDAVRTVVRDAITWPCSLEVQFADENLGCRRRVVTALDSVFAREERAIILEDDCLPSVDFFPYCEELLERYANDERVMAINGFTPRTQTQAESYFFSCHSLPWGWATWRRAWQRYDRDLETLDGAIDSAWPLRDEGGPGARYLAEAVRAAKAGRIDTWDFQWMFTIWTNGGVVAVPKVSLIRNIGFGPGALHTTDAGHHLADTELSPLSWPLSHPRWLKRHYEFDLKVPFLLFPWIDSRGRRFVRALRRRFAVLRGRRGARV